MDEMHLTQIGLVRVLRHPRAMLHGPATMRVAGHAQGVQSVRSTIEESCRLGLGQLTLYCLSVENWKRPQTEIDFLMSLLHDYLIAERDESTCRKAGMFSQHLLLKVASSGTATLPSSADGPPDLPPHCFIRCR